MPDETYLMTGGEPPELEEGGTDFPGPILEDEDDEDGNPMPGPPDQEDGKG